jgi:4-hydroxymandelate oxidase
VGRPQLWALSVGGADGVTHLLRLLAGELDRAMGLCGLRRLADVTPDLLSPRGERQPGP